MTAWAQLTPRKMLLMTTLLHTLKEGLTLRSREILEALGRLQWTGQAYPLLKPFLQPLYAWQRATHTAGRPPLLVRFLACCMLRLLEWPQRDRKRNPTPSTWYGASDARANETTAEIGGWICNKRPPTKDECYWFNLTMDKQTHSWAFDKGTPQQRIAALELYGTALLYKSLLEKQASSQIQIYLPMMTDNQGNAYSILNNNTRKWPCSAIVMEIATLSQAHNAVPAIQHKKREESTWADDLSNGNFTGFCERRRLSISDRLPNFWIVFQDIIDAHKTGQAAASGAEPRRSKHVK